MTHSPHVAYMVTYISTKETPRCLTTVIRRELVISLRLARKEKDFLTFVNLCLDMARRLFMVHAVA